MKNTPITKSLRFPEDHIVVILALFIPVWLGLLFVWAVVVNLLPSEISHAILIGTYQRSFLPGPTLRLMHITPPARDAGISGHHRDHCDPANAPGCQRQETNSHLSASYCTGPHFYVIRLHLFQSHLVETGQRRHSIKLVSYFETPVLKMHLFPPLSARLRAGCQRER